MSKALEQGDYPLAIELCADCQNDVEKYKRYHCVNELGNRFVEALEAIGDKLDTSLKDSARKFSPKAYERALSGYKLRGNPHQVQEVVLTHLSDLVDIVSHQVALAAVQAKLDPAQRDRYKGYAQASPPRGRGAPTAAGGTNPSVSARVLACTPAHRFQQTVQGAVRPDQGRCRLHPVPAGADGGAVQPHAQHVHHDSVARAALVRAPFPRAPRGARRRVCRRRMLTPRRGATMRPGGRDPVQGLGREQPLLCRHWRPAQARAQVAVGCTSFVDGRATCMATRRAVPPSTGAHTCRVGGAPPGAGRRQDVQRKASATLGAKSLASLKFEDFLLVLNLINTVRLVLDSVRTECRADAPHVARAPG